MLSIWKGYSFIKVFNTCEAVGECWGDSDFLDYSYIGLLTLGVILSNPRKSRFIVDPSIECLDG